MDDDEKVMRRHHELFAGKDTPYSPDWAFLYFERRGRDMGVVYSGETDSENFASGDDAEKIFSESAGGETFYWAGSSTSGGMGPFATLEEAIRALGYDPETFELS